MRNENVSKENISAKQILQEANSIKNSSKENKTQFSGKLQKSVLEVQRKYGDILGLPHHVSGTRPPMPTADRAAQFAPFAALTGHQAAIEEAARVTDVRMELDEEMKEQLSVKLQKIVSEPGRRIRIVYYVPDGRKSGGSYKTKIGMVKKIDEYQKILVLEDGSRIPFEDISEIE